MRTLRGRFILSHLLPILLVVPLVGLIAVYLLETQVLLTTVSSNLEQQARTIATAVTGNPDILGNPELAEQFLARFALQSDRSLVLYDSAGNVITAAGRQDSASSAAEISSEALALAQSGQPKVSITYGLLRQTAEVLVPVTGVDQHLIGLVVLTHTLEGVANQIARLRWWMLGILLVELILGGLVGALLAVRLARPIDHAARAVVEVSHGARIEPIAPEGPAELQALTDSVNELAERLRTLEDMRRRSLANIVHELGRPLGAMRSAVHVLRGAAGDDPALREELLAGVEAQIERLGPLLDDLAQLHGQVSGGVRLAHEKVLIQKWLPPVLLPWRAAALEKGLDWRAAVPPNLPEVSIDPTRLAQAVGNLLSNAVKYTSAPGRVAVDVEAIEGTLWIAVEDTGPGISPDEQRQVFQPFYRSVRERRFPQGLGLGLTIAQQIVEAHGGQLSLDGGREEGSRFVISLPLVEADSTEQKSSVLSRD